MVTLAPEKKRVGLSKKGGKGHLAEAAADFFLFRVREGREFVFFFGFGGCQDGQGERRKCVRSFAAPGFGLAFFWRQWRR